MERWPTEEAYEWPGSEENASAAVDHQEGWRGTDAGTGMGTGLG